MKTRNPVLAQALTRVKASIKAIAGNRFQLILFGSYARGQSHPDSDVDLLIVIPDECFSIEMQERIWDSIFDIGFDMDFLMVPMIVSDSQARRFEGFRVFASVEKEGIPI